MDSYNYTFGECNYCKKTKALKDGLCFECDKEKFPDFLNDIFKDKKE